MSWHSLVYNKPQVRDDADALHPEDKEQQPCTQLEQGHDVRGPEEKAKHMQILQAILARCLDELATADHGLGKP